VHHLDIAFLHLDTQETVLVQEPQLLQELQQLQLLLQQPQQLQLLQELQQLQQLQQLQLLLQELPQHLEQHVHLLTFLLDVAPVLAVILGFVDQDQHVITHHLTDVIREE
jgi:hypothetical protein